MQCKNFSRSIEEIHDNLRSSRYSYRYSDIYRIYNWYNYGRRRMVFKIISRSNNGILNINILRIIPCI